MNKLELAKDAAKLIISVGTGTVVANAIKSTTPPNAKLFQRLGVKAGGFVLSSMLSDTVAKYFATQFDEAVQEIRNGLEKPHNISSME